MDSLNVQPIGSLSSSSSSTSSCSSGNNSSSSLVSSSATSNHSFTNSTNINNNNNNNITTNNNNNSNKLINSKAQLNEVAYDFGAIMNDLKIACGTLSLLARQIDQVVGKIDDKFGFIFESISPNNYTNNNNNNSNGNIEIVSNQKNNSASHNSNEFMNCMKRTANNLNNINNRNFTKIIKNDLVNGNGMKNRSQKTAYDCTSFNNVSSGVGTNGSDVLSLIENRFRETQNSNNLNGIHLNINCNQAQKCPHSINYGTCSSSSLSSSSSSSNSNPVNQTNSLNDQLNTMKNKLKIVNSNTNNKRLNDNDFMFANIINQNSNNGNLNTENNNGRQVPNRALSERKASVNALLSNFVGLQLNGQNKTSSLKNTGCADFNGNFNNWNGDINGVLSPSLSSTNQSSIPYDATSTFISNGTSHYTNNKLSNTLGSSAKMKCTRSKSQPVFNKENYQNHVLSSESQKPSLFGCSSFKSNHSNNTSNINTNNNTIQQNKNLTSSPVCNYDTVLSENENNPKNKNNNNLQNDSSNPESSFYEDQLDNELESFSDSTAGLTVGSADISTNICSTYNSNANKVVKIISNDLDLDNLNGKNSNILCNTEINSKLSGIKSIQNTKTKSGNSNHHVSFNINNAIYTSRQETPIPISILKQSTVVNSTSNNNNNNGKITATASNSFENFCDTNKKSSPVCNASNEKERILNSKSTRADTKTTIL